MFIKILILKEKICVTTLKTYQKKMFAASTETYRFKRLRLINCFSANNELVK